jgi:hypothetical protein
MFVDILRSRLHDQVLGFQNVFSLVPFCGKFRNGLRDADIYIERHSGEKLSRCVNLARIFPVALLLYAPLDRVLRIARES